MVNDERCLTDLVVRDLEPVLTPEMAELGFQEHALDSLNPFEQQRIRQIDGEPIAPGRDFRDPNDRLIYGKDRTLMQVRSYRRTSSNLYDTAHPFVLLFRVDLEDHPEMQQDHAVRLIPTDEGLQSLVGTLRSRLKRTMYLSRSDQRRCDTDSVPATFWPKFEPEELPLDPRPNQLYFVLSLEAERQPRGHVEGAAKQRAVVDLSRTISVVANFTALYMARELQVYDEMRRADAAFSEAMSRSIGN